MAEEKFEILVDGVPYIVTATPFEFNTETRYKVNYNGVDHIFTWDASMRRLVSIDSDASFIPDNLELAIAKKLEYSNKI
jgi:hypothetical protein